MTLHRESLRRARRARHARSKATLRPACARWLGRRPQSRSPSPSAISLSLQSSGSAGSSVGAENGDGSSAQLPNTGGGTTICAESSSDSTLKCRQRSANEPASSTPGDTATATSPGSSVKAPGLGAATPSTQYTPRCTLPPATRWRPDTSQQGQLARDLKLAEQPAARGQRIRTGLERHERRQDQLGFATPADQRHLPSQQRIRDVAVFDLAQVVVRQATLKQRGFARVQAAARDMHMHDARNRAQLGARFEGNGGTRSTGPRVRDWRPTAGCNEQRGQNEQRAHVPPSARRSARFPRKPGRGQMLTCSACRRKN